MFKNTVSVFMLTYNQEHFIAQAIESILIQKTSYSFQLVIGEDCSTDKTREICESYALQYPEKIKLLPKLKKNIGLIANYMRTIKECDGKYIAICDGDDYWIDEFKLQKQVGFLESNPDFSIVYTNYKRLYPDGNFKNAVLLNTESETDFNDLIDNNFIPSVTVLFKNNLLMEKFPSWIIDHPYGDWPTYLWTIKDSGKIYLIDEITAVYRVEIGVSYKIIQKNTNWLLVNISILKNILNDGSFTSKKEIIVATIIKRKVHLMASYNKEQQFGKAIFQLLNNLILKTAKFKLLKLFLYSFYKGIKS